VTVTQDPRLDSGVQLDDRQAIRHEPQRLQDDCFRTGQARLRHDEAISILKKRSAAVTGHEQVELATCADRVLAASITAARAVPAHTNAAVDGYAFAATSNTRANGARLAVAGRAAAGHPFAVACAPQTAVRIFTGATMPDGADTVVMQEDVVLYGPAGSVSGEIAREPPVVEPPIVEIPAGLKPGSNVRKAGEDVAAGTMMFAQGHVLRPQDLAALASIGLAQVPCFARVRVAIVSTGDEVIAPGRSELRPGQVYDANAPMLAALCRNAGADVEMLGIWPDRLELVTERLREAASNFDVILTSGGASLGEEDHMAAALAAIGRRHMWQLAIKPGRPMMFGQITSPRNGVMGGGHVADPTLAQASATLRDTVVVGLPGNPVAVFVCFVMYVMPLIRALGGAKWREPRRFLMPAAFAFSGRKTGRREFWRGTIVERDGHMAVDKFARDGSGLISGLTAADGLIDIAEDHGDVSVGDLVPVIPLSEFGIQS